MRADAPPHLGGIVDRAGVEEEPYVALERVPVPIDIRHTAAWEEAGEDLRARGVQARVHVLDERRAGRVREELGQIGPEPVGDLHGSIEAVDGDMHMEAERVVPPDDVAQELVAQAVVGRVDDSLFLPGAPGVRPGGAEGDSELLGERGQLRASLGQSNGDLGEGVATARADFDLGCDQLADEVLFELRPLGGRLQLLEAIRERQRLRVEDRELLLDGDGEIVGRLVLLTRESQLLVGG